MLSGPSRLSANGLSPKKMVVLLHGVGADGNDLIDLADEFSSVIKDALFLSPNAPYPYDMFSVGYQWFSLLDRSEEVLYNGMKSALPILKRYIDENLAKYNLQYKDLILIGFSQGAMMAVQLALRLEEACSAVIGFSGALIGYKHLEDEMKSKPAILLVHGEHDQVIPKSSYVLAVKNLKKMNLEIEGYLLDDLAHGINFECINIAKQFLKNRLDHE